MWTMYGILVRNWIPLVLANSIGVVAGVCALSVFRALADHKSASAAGRFLGLYLMAIILVLSSMQYVIIDPSAYPRTKERFGFVCVCVTVLMYASPLVTVREVMRTRSTATLSPSMTLASLAASSLWFVYGVLIEDSNVWLPNVAGLSLSVAQFGLFATFGVGPSRSHGNGGGLASVEP